MSRQEEIRKNMFAAMKGGNKKLKDSLSMLLQALQKAEKEKMAPLTEAEEASVILKEIKQLNETIEACPKERADIINECKERIAVFTLYAPTQMSGQEIRAEIGKVLTELGIEGTPSAKDKGRIMKLLMPRVKGKADGRKVNELVGELFIK